MHTKSMNSLPTSLAALEERVLAREVSIARKVLEKELPDAVLRQVGARLEVSWQDGPDGDSLAQVLGWALEWGVCYQRDHWVVGQRLELLPMRHLSPRALGFLAITSLVRSGCECRFGRLERAPYVFAEEIPAQPQHLSSHAGLHPILPLLPPGLEERLERAAEYLGAAAPLPLQCSALEVPLVSQKLCELGHLDGLLTLQEALDA